MHSQINATEPGSFWIWAKLAKGDEPVTTELHAVSPDDAIQKAINAKVKHINSVLNRDGYFDERIGKVSAEVIDGLKKVFEEANWEVIVHRDLISSRESTSNVGPIVIIRAR